MLSKYLTQVGLLGSKCLIKSPHLRILGAHAHVNGLFKIQPQNFSTTSQIQMSTDAKQEPKKKGNKLLWIGAFTIGFGFYLLSDFDEYVEDVKPPSMKIYGIDIFPLMKKIFRILPDSKRKNFAIKKVNIYTQLDNNVFIIGILLNCARCITNTRMWWRIMHSTSDERSESRVLCIILHHMRVLVIHLKQFTSICITFTLLNKQNLNLIHHHPW